MIDAPNFLPLGLPIRAGRGVSIVVADFDFETYSEAGFVWDAEMNRWTKLVGAREKGIGAVGAGAYTEHPTAEVLSLAYNLKDYQGVQHWIPGDPAPIKLFNYLANGGLIEAWNVSFERWVWENICVPKYGWPPLPINQLRCAMAKSRAHALPGSLDKAGQVLNTHVRKEKDGTRLLKKFSMPRDPTLKDSRKRILPPDDPDDAQNLYDYNAVDIEAEAEISSHVPDLNEFELRFWQCDQAINHRGVQLDREIIEGAIRIVEQAMKKYNSELCALTDGEVSAASEIMKLGIWIGKQGVKVTSLTADIVESLLKRDDLPANVRRALEIRELIGSAAVKKLYAMRNQITRDGRIHDLFIYHSARTGRAAGAAVQPQNLPNSGMEVQECLCGRYTGLNTTACHWCGYVQGAGAGERLTIRREWNDRAMEDAIETISTGNLELVEMFWGDALGAISGCLRGMFIAKPGHDLICSDYSAIEAVVLAALAGEEWRLEVFRTHGKIYEMSASKITGIPFEEFERHKKTTGQHHPMRKKVGKVAELASGYQGWIGAWKNFGADEFFNDEEMKRNILAWRAASPRIVEMWGGQEKNYIEHYYGLEGMAIQAVLNPGKEFSFRGLIKYLAQDDILYCELPSGRYLTYHRPRLAAAPSPRRGLQLSFEGWNTNPKNGGIGWIRMSTYGGKLTENVVQAAARDLLACAIVRLEGAGYPVVLHIHDEICCEIPCDFGSIEEFEHIMGALPAWARDWPLNASGGWRGKRYRK